MRVIERNRKYRKSRLKNLKEKETSIDYCMYRRISLEPVLRTTKQKQERFIFTSNDLR